MPDLKPPDKVPANEQWPAVFLQRFPEHDYSLGSQPPCLSEERTERLERAENRAMGPWPQ